MQQYLSFGDAYVSLERSISAARENARSVREVISLEAWESINELYLWSRSPEARAEFDEHRYGFYRRIRREMQLCLGLLRGTMLHDEPLDFIWLGVVLERTGQTARILDVHHYAFMAASNGAASNGTAAAHGVVEVSLWLALLRACYGFEAFMKSHRGQVTAHAVASFLVFEPKFPRAVRHCVLRAREGLQQIRPQGSAALTRIKSLERDLEARAGDVLDAATVHDILTHVVEETHTACDEIATELFGSGQVQIQSQDAPKPDSAASKNE